MFEAESPSVAQVGFELMVLLSAGITNMCHYAWSRRFVNPVCEHSSVGVLVEDILFIY